MIKVRVPGTSANIGPGFDCLGMAVSIYNTFYFDEIEEGLEFEGCDSEYANEDNLVYKSMKVTFEKIGYKPKGIRIKISNDIPISRGLGSSASCIIGGIIGANEIAGGVLSRREMINLATEIEGHPDNVVPAMVGGITTSVLLEDGKVYYSKINSKIDLKLCALIPDFTLSTEMARAVLPKSIPFSHGVFNISRTSLLVSCLNNGDIEGLKIACEDRLHQEYRGKLIRNYENIVKKSLELNSICTFLSGAGPTIMVAVKDQDSYISDMEKYLENLGEKWRIEKLYLDDIGAIWEKL